MRLDKFLKVSRVIKRRTVANDTADAGRITLNGRIAKASAEVKEGDVIEIAFGNSTGRYRILQVRETANRDQAEQMVEEIL